MKINRKAFVVIVVTLFLSGLCVFARTRWEITGYFNVKKCAYGDVVQAVGAQIQVKNVFGQIVYSALTGEEGRAEIENLPFPGTYIVSLEGYESQTHNVLPFSCTYDITL